ncbi:MAG TPA: winged helix-turn-helix domain-containing protein [Usitatibacter sp.]|nr:winged helix-turn-helix domain-containing protein [Usitatibacter sp.]
MARVRVRIEMLGGFAVRVGGRELPLGRKVPRRPLDLLKYLALHAGGQVPEAEVARALWPDREQAVARRSLTVTLHRLRRLLGLPDAIFRRDGRMGVDAESVWCDAVAFERLLADAARCADKRRRTALAAAALDLYRGELLAGETRLAWVLPIRARLEQRHVEGGRIRNRSVIRPSVPSDAALASTEVEP